MSLHIHSAAHDASKCFVCLVELTCGHMKYSRPQVCRVILQRSSGKGKFIWELALYQKEFLVSVIVGAESVGQDAQKNELKLREKMVKEKFADKSLAFSLHQVSSGGFLQMVGFVWACRPSVWQTSRKVQLRLWRPKRLCKKKHSIGWRLVHLSTHVSGVFFAQYVVFFLQDWVVGLEGRHQVRSERSPEVRRGHQRSWGRDWEVEAKDLCWTNAFLS